MCIKHTGGFNPEQTEKAKGTAGFRAQLWPFCCYYWVLSCSLSSLPAIANVSVSGHKPLPLPGQDRVWLVCGWGAWLLGSGWSYYLPAWAESP